MLTKNRVLLTELTNNSIDVSANITNEVSVKLNEIAGNFKSNDDSLNINIMRINDKASAFFNTGPATDGTLKVVLTNDYLSTTKAQITDISMNSQTTNVHVEEQNVDFSYAIYNLRNQGQSTMDTSFPVVLSNDYASTVTSRYLLENSYYYYRQYFRLNGLTNLAQNLTGITPPDTTLLLFGNVIYIDKIILYIRFTSGTPDVAGWGTTGSVSVNFTLRTQQNSNHVTDLATSMTNNGDIIKYFDYTTFNDFGTGDCLRGVMHFRPYKFKIDLTNGGSIYYTFSPSDFSDGGAVGEMTSEIYYYSDTSNI